MSALMEGRVEKLRSPRLRLVSLALALPLLVVGCGDDNGDGDGAGDTRSGETPKEATFPTRTIEAGEITIEIEPERIDSEGAVFEVSFDTHSVELDLDVAASSQLTVAERPWAGASWEGDPAGGHHRGGRLSFDAGGEATGEARLTMTGLAGPVEASWDVGE